MRGPRAVRMTTLPNPHEPSRPVRSRTAARRIARLLLLAASLLATAPARADPVDDLGGGTDFGQSYKPLDTRLSATRKTVTIRPPSTETPRYYRLRLMVTNPDRAPWTVVIRAPRGQVLATFDQRETACEETNGCWSIRLLTSQPSVQFETASPTARAEVPEALFMPATARKAFYSVMPNSRVTPLGQLALPDTDRLRAVHDLADHLGLFIGSGPTPDGQRTANWCCSGVRLTGDLFLTNWHCGAAAGMPDGGYWTTGPKARACRSGIVDLSWDEDQVGREYGCQTVAFVDKPLDAAVLRLAPLADGPALTAPLRPLAFGGPDEPAAGAELQVFHHPACEPKAVTRACTVAAATVPGWSDRTRASEFSHLCTTERGSSGGPVFDAAGRLVGLHHQGVDPARGPGNFAVRMADLLAAIAAADPALHREITGAPVEVISPAPSDPAASSDPPAPATPAGP